MPGAIGKSYGFQNNNIVFVLKKNGNVTKTIHEHEHDRRIDSPKHKMVAFCFVYGQQVELPRRVLNACAGGHV